MNHTQTAQDAMAQAAAGQALEVQTEQTVQIGFEKALVMMNPNWRTALSPEQINQFRHFYHRGVQDISFLIQMSNHNMEQNLNAVMNTVIVTGNEEQIAKAQREATEAEDEAAQEKPTKSRRTAKPNKAPASKAGSVAANRGAPKATPKSTATFKAAPKAAPKKAKK